jgi:phosphate transport system permease protein
MVYGSISLAIGDEKGNLSTWMEVQDNPQVQVRNLRQIHVLKKHQKSVVAILPSARDKSLTSIDLDGTVHVDHMTSERHLLTLSDRKLHLVNVAPRNNTLIGLDRQGSLIAVAVDMPHPEISFKTLFGKVWYESYDQPAYVWQSSAGSDDFEPKFSITPLLFGTIKGTLYAMLFAIPLSIFGAAYISQFSSGRFKKTIKPAIEIMASVPSVVIGFLIALWLAPLIEKGILSVFASLILLPLFFVLFMMLWQLACSRSEKLRNMKKGYEFLILAPILILSVLAAVQLGPVLERLFFADNFKLWLFNSLGTTYDQRNCIIIAFGLGFTVIPIIFSIAEDSLSNVPPNLTAASLALGASRWQTVWRVVLPSASPGIFAGIMIGFGRAVGETMIVLMATGNTPIMDWSIFNGMRTLSANIAVEIPEAPLGGTLYRVLFLCAVILFILTFLLNTGAEVIRDHLRKKYMRY